MKELSPKARRLFELSRDQDGPDASAQSRVERALFVRIAMDPSSAAVGSAAPTAGAGLASVVAKPVLLASIAGTLVVAGWLTLKPTQKPPRHAPAPAAERAARVVASPAMPNLVQEPARVSPAAETVSERSGSAKARRKIAVAPAMPPEPAPSSVPPALELPDLLRAETAALRAAQSALRDGKAQHALALLDEQDARFHKGALEQERAAARVLALCQVGSVAEARAQADRFARLWPRSALLARVRSACWDR